MCTRRNYLHIFCIVVLWLFKLQVAQIEESVNTLKQSNAFDSSPRCHDLRKKPTASPVEQHPRPLIGSTTEDDIPETRVECSDDLVLPSVKNLRSIFNIEKSPEISSSQMKRVRHGEFLTNYLLLSKSYLMRMFAY